MFTRMVSWNTGNTIAPPSMTTFCPPRPVRTKERSFEERRYRREKMIPTTSSARKAMPARISLSIISVVIRYLPGRSTKTSRQDAASRAEGRRASSQIRSGHGFTDASEATAGDLLGEQDALAALKCHALGVRLDHHVEVLAVFVLYSRLGRISLSRRAVDDRRDATDQRLERHRVRLILRDQARESCAENADDRQRREERSGDAR